MKSHLLVMNKLNAITCHVDFSRLGYDRLCKTFEIMLFERFKSTLLCHE